MNVQPTARQRRMRCGHTEISGFADPIEGLNDQQVCRFTLHSISACLAA
jgi:hypothetical protein